MKEYILCGKPKGSTDPLDSTILSTTAKTPAELDLAKNAATKDGWHSFSVQILDLGKPCEYWVDRNLLLNNFNELKLLVKGKS